LKEDTPCSQNAVKNKKNKKNKNKPHCN